MLGYRIVFLGAGIALRHFKPAHRKIVDMRRIGMKAAFAYVYFYSFPVGAGFVDVGADRGGFFVHRGKLRVHRLLGV